jgi:hypothetical protein
MWFWYLLDGAMTESQIIGSTIAGYKLVRKLGSGQIGSVFLGEKSEDIVARRAIKLVKTDDLRVGWQNEINKVTSRLLKKSWLG